jgi:hypothetical protein
MFELDETLELNETTLTWVDRTYRTERGLRRFLATLTPAQLAEAEVLVDDNTFVVFYPVVMPVKKAGREVVFHFDLTEGSESCPPAQDDRRIPAFDTETEKVERARAFNSLLASVRL